MITDWNFINPAEFLFYCGVKARGVCIVAVGGNQYAGALVYRHNVIICIYNRIICCHFHGNSIAYPKYFFYGMNHAKNFVLLQARIVLPVEIINFPLKTIDNIRVWVYNKNSL